MCPIAIIVFSYSFQIAGAVILLLWSFRSCDKKINVLFCFSTVFANGIKAHHIAKSTCNHLAVRAAVTSAFSYSVLFIACRAVNARERMRAHESGRDVPI